MQFPSRPRLALLVFLAFLGVASPVAAQQGEAISTGRETVSDAEIDARIEGILDEIDGLQAVSATVRAGVVTLHGSVAEASLRDQATELANRVNGVVAVSNEISEATSVSERLTPVYDRLAQRALRTVGYLPLFAVAAVSGALVFAGGLFIAGRDWPWRRVAPNAFIADLLRQLVRLAFLVLGAVLALDILDATAFLGTILGAAGIAGLAIGFAVRDTVENYIASILLSIRQPFRPKDYILIESYEGFVIGLTSRATILLDHDGNHIRIPNATVFKSNITNFSRNPQRRFLFRLGVDAESNLERALAVGTEQLRKLDFVLADPRADAWIEEVGDSNVVLTFAGWIDQKSTDFVKARSEAMRLVKLRLEETGFTLPEPIYRLRFDTPPSLDGKQAAAVADVSKPGGEAGAPETKNASDTTPDTAVVQKVDAERAEAAPKDLLDDSAPNEIPG
ncbi:mechanosensitive ion channel family protein [Oricola cellulosilytica]|nr:mechanosensitive ion channel family protein [Oricola cellulosilytica]